MKSEFTDRVMNTSDVKMTSGDFYCALMDAVVSVVDAITAVGSFTLKASELLQ